MEKAAADKWNISHKNVYFPVGDEVRQKALRENQYYLIADNFVTGAQNREENSMSAER